MIKLGKPVPADVETRLPSLMDALKADNEIHAVWLFGSRARNESDTLSDVDLAVLVRDDLSGRALWDRQLAWTRLAGETLRTDEVAIQVVNRLPAAPRYQVLKGARLLWARSPEVAADFDARTLKEYLDFKPSVDRYDRELFEQAVTGRLR